MFTKSPKQREAAAIAEKQPKGLLNMNQPATSMPPKVASKPKSKKGFSL